MPATEKTWRDQPRMHVIFGISSLVMLAGTIWMLARDHNREWTKWQLDDRAVQRWTTEAQLAQAEADLTGKLDQLRKDLAAAQSGKVDVALVERFKQLVQVEEQQPAGPNQTVKQPDFSKIDAALARLTAAEN